ncbi:MAG: hypothetical protein RL336_1682 [Pseudomonadota bacterium]|jgi:Ca-activated chloride channel family protein
MSWLPLAFVRPMWLLFCIPPLIALWYYARLPDKRAQAPAIVEHLREALTVRRASGRWLAPLPLAMIALFVTGIALSGPSWQKQDTPLKQDEGVIILALDASVSMHQSSASLSYWEHGLLKSRDLLAALPAVKVGVIAFAGSAHWVLPPSRDKALLDYTLAGLTRLQMPIEGKYWQRIEGPIEQLSLPVASVIVLSDRLTTSDNSLPWQIHWWRAGAHHDAVDGISGVNLSVDDSDIKQLQQWVQRDLAKAAGQGEQWRDDGYYFVLPMALLVLLWFRRGWSMAWSILLVSQWALYSPPSSASDGAEVMGWFFSGDQRGRYYAEQGDYQGAAQSFEDPLWRGLSYYHSGQYSEAVEALLPLDTPYARLMLANALAQQNQLPRALAILYSFDGAHPYADVIAQNIAVIEQRLADQREMAASQQTDMDEQAELEAVASDEEVDETLLIDSAPNEVLSGRDIIEQEALAERWMAHINTAVGDYLTAVFALQAVDGSSDE